MSKKNLFFFLVILFALSLFSAKAFLASRESKKPKTTPIKTPEISVTIIEGWQISDLAEDLEQKGVINSATLYKTLKAINTDSYPLLSSKPAKASLEGYIFPDTYRVYKPKNQTDEKFARDLLKKALENFQDKFTTEMAARAKTQGYTVYQILTLASIIEKETGRNVVTPEQKQALQDERQNVASVFYNRMKAGMPLESDATINYATGKNNPTPTQAELKTVSAYNTYLNKGLPPGPICNPSLSSLMAALYPNQTGYYFFLHKQPSGEPVFSKTFEEHVGNKFKYLK
ncbi:MAG: endolytic transglycosylase MltG [Patescibacteria group bacterium]|nr:endolytic transglycosylase MltG [Patescibacteria group bacterium]